MPVKFRNDLNGLRIKLPGQTAIYLMDLGKKRHIPNMQVYKELFLPDQKIVEDINIDDIPTSTPIPETTILFKVAESPKVFLLDNVPPNQVKRHITSMDVIERYKFNWDHIHVWDVPLNALRYPDGVPIQNP